MGINRKIRRFQHWMVWMAIACLTTWVGNASPKAEKISSPNIYVGSESCGKCHENEYKRFFKYSKKPYTYNHIRLMKKGLTEEEFQQCFQCHATGYGQPGGFRSEKETPHLKSLGCEACHGPGGRHSKSGDPAHIRGKLTTDVCQSCHVPDRIESFRYKPLLFGNAH